MARDDEIDRRRRGNLEHLRENGPGLSTGYSTWVIARAPGKVLLGGLGGMGVGTMWVTESKHHRENPTYFDAPWDPEQRDGFGDYYNRRGDF